MLSGRFVNLRAVERADLAQLLEWRNRPQFRRYFREYRELSMAQQERWFETVVLGDPRTVMFSVIQRESDRLIGAAGLCSIDSINRSADFSLYVGADELYIDGSFAPDASRLLLNYGFQELNLHRVWAEVYSTDGAKQDLLGSLGFRVEGRHRHTRWTEGTWVDSLFYGMLRDEWHDTSGEAPPKSASRS